MPSRSLFLLATFAVSVCISAPSTGAKQDEPYRYTSQKDASDAELFRFMADAKSEIDREHEAKGPDRLPADFWVTDAKSAAVGLLDVNRSEEHRAAYTLVANNRDEATPPERCNITISSFSSRCYNAVDGHYFLRVHPQDSYLAYAESWSGGNAFYSVVHDQPAFDFRLCPLSYQDARKIADVIWWLNRIQTESTTTDSDLTSSAIVSTADGSGKITLRGEGKLLIEVGASLWAGYLSEYWSGEYEPDVFLNFAAYLIRSALPERLGSEWTKFEPKHPPDFDFDRIQAPAYEEAERSRLSQLAMRFLDAFTLDQEKISFAIVGEAARLSGRFALAGAADRLPAILDALPPPEPKRRSAQELFTALDKLPHEWKIKDLLEQKRITQQRATLEAERDWHLYDRGVNTSDYLRDRITPALRALAVADNAAKLEEWALSRSPGAQWAMQRLGQVDKKRYADVLEASIARTEAKWARQFFDELAKVDVERARALARRLPASKRDALAISAFLVLRETWTLPDQSKRLATIIKILHNPKTEWEERARAIDVLVPVEAPLRYSGREIDDALLKLLGLPDKDRFVVARAGRALARRGRTEFFDLIAPQLKEQGEFGALAKLAQADPALLKPRLRELVEPQLIATNQNVEEILWAIWSADLRDLQPRLERLATYNIDEIEDGKADSAGGDVTAVTGRFHFARKVVSFWSEPDPFTRARLLIAFAVAEPYSFVVRDDTPERTARLKAEMARAADELSPEGKQELDAFLHRIDADPPRINSYLWEDGIYPKITAFAREALRL